MCIKPIEVLIVPPAIRNSLYHHHRHDNSEAGLVKAIIEQFRLSKTDAKKYVHEFLVEKSHYASK